MTYSFTGSGTSIIVTADTETGNFPIDNQSYSGASAILANDRIYLREYGMDKQNFAFFEISTIDGVAPTDLEDAFEKLLLLIANFNGGGTAPYKVYTALLTQSGTDAPVATVLENTLGGEITFSYTSPGFYSVNTTGEFPINRTLFSISNTFNGGVSSESYIGIFSDTLNVNTIDFTTLNDENTALDDILLNTPIEIRVYN